MRTCLWPGAMCAGRADACISCCVPGYVDNALSKAGTALKVDVRGKINDAVVTKMPFVPTHYFKG